MAAFELGFSTRKEFKKKKVSGEIAFVLISLFHLQIQEPASSSIITRAFLFLAKFAEFYCLKIFETKVSDDLSIWVDECSLCGLSITGNIKICQCHMIKR